MISYMISRLLILVFGNLYPAYASYKAVRTKSVEEYVKWMMYWVVYALFTCAETFTDVLFAFWFPFYYEIKIVFLIYILSPYTKGSSILYRKVVHPKLKEREQEIDEVIAHAKEQGCNAILSWGTKGVNYATSVIMETAIKGGGGLMNHLRKSYSLTDLAGHPGDVACRSVGLGSLEEEQDAVDSGTLNLRYPMLTSRRSGSISSPLELYFSETDLDIKQRGKLRPRLPISFIQSSDDISSGYSSADALYTASAASTPTADQDLDEVLLQKSLVESPRTRLRKSSRTISTNVVPVKQVSEGKTSAPAAELKVLHLQHLKEMAVPSPLLSQILLAKLDENCFFKDCSSDNKSKAEISPFTLSRNPNKEYKVQNFLLADDGENIDFKEEKGVTKIDRKSGSSGFDEQNASSTDAIRKIKLPSDSVYFSEEYEGVKAPAAGVDSEDKNLCQGLRAGRYGKFRAPCPPPKEFSHSESMLMCEIGSVVNARMSLVSSKTLSGSIDILVESDVRSE